MRPLYIFDIDGTLCNIEHRLHFLNDKSDPNRWDKFYNACKDDTPNYNVIDTMESLRKNSDIWFFSGRSMQVRYETCMWFHVNTSFKMDQFATNPEWLWLRALNDHSDDHNMKEIWLHGMLSKDRDRLVAVFEDRKRVVDMWRANGVTCFQVAPGDF